MFSAPSLSLRSLAIWCAAAMALSACSGGSTATEPPGISGKVTASPAVVDPTSSPAVVDPAVPVDPSLPAGIPTAAPVPAPTSEGDALNASALITLATPDPATGGLLVGGYVSGVAEDGGDCGYVVTSAAGDSVTVHTEGVENNGSTSCGSTIVEPSQAPAGSYTVVLRYINDKGEAVSDAVKVDVP